MRALASLALLGLLLAGCVSTPTTTPPGPGPTPAALSGWVLDCTLGAASRAVDANDSATWKQECVARGSHTPGSKTEMWTSVNPANPLNVVVGSKDLDPDTSAHCVWNGLAVTHDGGKTWKDVTIGGKYADRKPGDPTFGYACNTDPDFQFDKKGDLHYGVEMYNFLSSDANGTLMGTPPGLLPGNPVGSGFKILLATSHDGGDTWPDIITFQPDLVVTTDYSRMAIDPATQAIVEAIGSDGGGGCHVLSSTDGGKSARPFVDVQTPYGPPCNSGAGTAVAISPKGVTVLVGGQVTDPTQLAAGNGLAQPIVVRSTDDGLTWLDSNPGFTYKPIGAFNESKYRHGSVIELAYDTTTGPRAGTLYAVVSTADRDEADIFALSSKDDGKTWSKPVRVNQDAPGPHQWMPNVGVAQDGSVHVFWMDKRWDPQHKLIDIAHAVSTDGGLNWTDERVTTVSFDGDLGVHQNGFPFIGDYLGVQCAKDDCWAGFPDAHQGSVPVIAAAHVHRAGNVTG
jgi:hypothetical protein